MRLFVLLIICSSIRVSAQQVLQQISEASFTTHPASTYSINQEEFTKALRVPIGNEITCELTIPGKGLQTCVLQRVAVTDSTSRFMAETSDGALQIPTPTCVLLYGSIKNQPNSVVSLSVFRTWATGYIRYQTSNSSERYIISPMSTAPLSTIIIYNEKYATAVQPWQCATPDQPVTTNAKPTFQEGTQSLKRIRLALECDVPFYDDFGGDVTRATEYATAVVAAVSEIYQRDVNATLYIGDLTIFTVTDPYPGTVSDDLLVQFRNYWRTNKTGVQRTLAHLFSGINGIGGVAYLDVLCSNLSGYGVSGLDNRYTYPNANYLWDTDVTAHEIGHNVGSPHTHSCTWNPAIDSCVTAEGNCYQTPVRRKGTIMSYCHQTPFGKDLEFHSRCITLMKNELAAATCAATHNDLVVNAGNDVTICPGTSYLIPATITGGSTPYTITWTPNLTIVNAGTIQPTVNPTTTTTYYVEVRDQYNAVVRDSIVVSVYPNVAATIPDSLYLCSGDRRTIISSVTSGAAPFTYQWVVNGVTNQHQGAQITIEASATTQVLLTVTDQNSCTVTDTTNIVVFSPPVVTINAPATKVCYNQQIQLQATAQFGKSPYTYEWYANNSILAETSATLTTNPVVNTMYKVIVYDVNGCSDTAQAQVTLRNVGVSVSPQFIQLPAMAACETSRIIQLEISNTGNDTLYFDSVQATRYGVLNNGVFPLTILAGLKVRIPLQLQLPVSGLLADTLVLQDRTCGIQTRIPISGTRPFMNVVVKSLSPQLVCETPLSRTLVLSVTNTSDFPATFSGIIDSAHPNTRLLRSVEIEPRRTSDCIVELQTTTNEPVLQRTLTLQYQQTTCSGSVRSAITPILTIPVLEAPDSVLFGATSSVTDTIRKPLSIVPGNATQNVTITKVQVSGPFATTLQEGTILQQSRARNEQVLFIPTLAGGDGTFTGELRFELDSCESAETIVKLVATRNTLGIVDTKEAGETLQYVDGYLFVPQGCTEIVVFDVLGKRMLEKAILGNAALHLPLPVGVYYVVCTSQNGNATVYSFVV